jgi:hypothetical protein
MDVVSGRIGALFTVNSAIAVGYPSLNGDDTVLYFSDYFFSGGVLNQTIVGSIPLSADGLSFSGDAQPTLGGNAAGPLISAVYRRGQFTGLPTVEVSATVPETSRKGAAPGVFTLSRTGSTAAAFSVSFVFTGTARNGTDYFGVPLSATIAAGFSSTTVSILPLDAAASQDDQTVILNLSPASHYLLGEPGIATVTIVGDGSSGPDFAAWALARGVVGVAGNEDGDGYPNLLEFALGTNPNQAEPPGLIRGELMTVNQQQFLSLVVSRQANNPAVIYTVEVADAVTGPWSFGTPHTQEVENSPTRLVVRDSNPMGTRASRYMRLRVSLP